MIWKVFDFLTPRNFIFNPFYVIKVSQDFKVLHWAVIRSGNLPVSALQALVLQYLFTPNSNFKNFFSSSGSVSSLQLQAMFSISGKSLR